jgi:hypothetical protein
LRPRVYYDENPPSKAHWTYKLFVQKIDPETNEPMARPDDYAAFKINPGTTPRTSPTATSTRWTACRRGNRKRFRDGEFGDATPGALFTEETSRSGG